MSGPTGGSLVSIVLPTHNGSRFLRRSVESCLGQTHRDIELILVDDASTDATPELVASFGDPRIVRLRNERNLGLPASLNAGFARSRGEYLTWTSDDNWYEPHALERMLGFLIEQGARFVRADIRLHYEDGSEPDRVMQLPEEVSFDVRNPVLACFLYHRSVLEKVGEFDTEAVLAEDYDYWIRASKHFELRRLGETLYHYRMHDGSLSAGAQHTRGVRIAACLVRLKHGLSSAQAEADRFAEELGWARYRASALPLRAAGRLLRVLSGGRLELAERKVSKARAECLEILSGYAAGGLRLAQAAGRMTGMFAAVPGA